MSYLAVFLDKDDELPLYEQLYRFIIKEISNNRFTAGKKLPGKRTAAQQLGVSVNTVDEAYQMLAAEGYVTAKPRSGFYVNKLDKTVLPPRIHKNGNGVPPPKPPQQKVWRYSFASADIDPELFPAKTWNRLFRETLSGSPTLYEKGDAFGDVPLRLAICDYLRAYRGVRCKPEQLVVGAGLETLVGMLARLFAGQRVALENPGYTKTARILNNEGIETCWVPVDKNGLRCDKLKESGARAAYLTPSHQFPTGYVMPVGRRTELLRWASDSDGFLIEDDYDSEFRFDGRPLPSLQGLDREGHVVYAGTFSRSLAPGLRVAYLVLPPRLLARWKKAYGGYSCTVSRPEQHTLARFMADGHFARSLNRMRTAYREKRDVAVKALRRHLEKDSFSLANTHTGHYLIVKTPPGKATVIAQQAAENHIFIKPMKDYYHADAPPAPQDDALILGYGGFAMDAIPDAVAAFATIYNKALR